MELNGRLAIIRNDTEQSAVIHSEIEQSTVISSMALNCQTMGLSVTYLDEGRISAPETPFIVIATMKYLDVIVKQFFASYFVYAAFELAVMKLHHLRLCWRVRAGKRAG